MGRIYFETPSIFEGEASVQIYLIFVWSFVHKDNEKKYTLSAVHKYLNFNMIKYSIRKKLVAERLSSFCLARNLIQPLRSTHNFTQSG